MKKLLLALCLLTAANAIAQYKFTGFDIFPGGSNSSNPANFMTVGGRFYFTATTSGAGTELYTINPPFNQAGILKDINAGSIGSNPGDFFDYNGKLIFTADEGATGKELWISDGTTGGTQMIQDILLGSIGSSPHGFCICDGKLYFAATTLGEGEELWVTDGTSSGTHLVKDIRTGNNNSFLSNLYSFKDTLYFGADDGTGKGTELWKSDGTSSGTVLVKDIASGVLNGNPQMFTTLNGKLYFVANTPTTGDEWWTTDGTSTGTTMIIDLAPTMPGGVMTINKFAMVFNNSIYFNGGVAGTTGPELYKTDGTSTGTVLVKEMTMGAGGTTLSWPLITGNKLYYTADVFATGKELWVSDGATAGTSMVSDIISGSVGSNPSNPIAFGSKVFFAANNAASDRQLFLTDGTAAGTKMIQPSGGLADGLNTGVFTGGAVLDTMLFFAANYDTKNAELWMIRDTTSSNNVEHINTVNTIAIYPNPNDGNFTVQLSDANFIKGSISVYDLLGREIYSQSQINSKCPITLNTPKGVYLVKVQLDEAVITKRIVVQ